MRHFRKMIVNLKIGDSSFTVDLGTGTDLSIGYGGNKSARCYYAPTPDFEPVKGDGWIGSVNEGFSVNYYQATIIPHGQGTHTECVGHITKEMEKVGNVLQEHHFMAQLISVFPILKEDGDRVIQKEQLEKIDIVNDANALIIRTMPNFSYKTNIDYTGSNPCYISADALAYLADLDIDHLLVDLPSVDRESDGGKLAAHRAFWNGDRKERATITELIYVPEKCQDGLYFLNLQISTLDLDAVPSRPIIYPLNKT